MLEFKDKSRFRYRGSRVWKDQKKSDVKGQRSVDHKQLHKEAFLLSSAQHNHREPPERDIAEWKLTL